MLKLLPSVLRSLLRRDLFVLLGHYFFRLFPALLSAIAMACFCGAPDFISVEMFFETALLLLPFTKGTFHLRDNEYVFLWAEEILLNLTLDEQDVVSVCSRRTDYLRDSIFKGAVSFPNLKVHHSPNNHLATSAVPFNFQLQRSKGSPRNFGSMTLSVCIDSVSFP